MDKPPKDCAACSGEVARWRSSGSTWRGGMGTTSSAWDQWKRLSRAGGKRVDDAGFEYDDETFATYFDRWREVPLASAPGREAP